MKFAIIATVFLVAALVPTILMVRSQNSYIAAATKEEEGVVFFKPLFALARDVSLHRLARQAVPAGAQGEGQDSRENLRAAIEQDLEQLARVDPGVCAHLGTEAAAGDLRSRWTALLAEPDARRQGLAHATLLGAIGALESKAVDSSLLIADPVVVSFYLVDMATVHLPEQADKSLNVVLAAQGGPGRDPAAAADWKPGLQRQTGAIQGVMNSIQDELGEGKAFANPEVAHRLGGLLKHHVETTHALFKLLGSVIQDGRAAAPGSALGFAGREAVKGCFTFQETAMRVLEDLLLARIHDRRNDQRWAIAGALTASLLAFYLLAALYAAFRYGFGAMGSSFSALALGDLTCKAKVDSRDELGALAGHLNQALDDVRLIQQQRDQYLGQKLKIEGELSVAREIQMGMVPKMFPHAPNWPECSLFALLHSAREVGGDFYDFYLDNEGRLIFTIGDVSDKGVPAALFMAQTRTLLRGMCAPGQMPHELLGRVNRELADGNALSMFVTIFCAKLDLATGELWFSNAGHNPPLLIRQGTRVEWLKLPPGLVLGAFPSTIFTTEKIILAPGDGILAYTDGVTEALNVQGRMYSEQRLVETLQGMSGATPRQIVDGLQASVEAFALGADQSDDVTLIAIKYLGRDHENLRPSASGSLSSWL